MTAVVRGAEEPWRESPETIGRLKAVTARFQRMIDENYLAGAVLLVAHHNQVVLRDALGLQDIERRIPMRTDSIFQVMSQTKSVTAIGIMTLADEGRLSLNDPIERYLPEFRGLQLKDGDTLRLPKRKVEIWTLLAQMSGIAHDAVREVGEMAAKMDHPLADMMPPLAKAPLISEPGSEWAYCSENSMIAARIIEVISGQPFEQYIKEHVFDPLGMKDSCFFLPNDARSRVAMLYGRVRGSLEIAGPGVTGGDPRLFRAGAKYSAPESGMYSTADDMAALHLMMLNGGTWRGRRVLSQAAVEAMTSVHTGDLPTKYPGSGWGLGWHVVKDPAGARTYLSLGTYGHGGGFGTYAFVDASKDLVAVLMVQTTGTPFDMRGIFTSMVNAAVDRE